MTDFASLREASSSAYLSPPAPLPRLPRELVLTTHQQAIERERYLDQRGEVRTRKVVVGPGKHYATGRAMEDLETVELGAEGGLRTNEVGEGKVFVCRIISRCLRTVAIQFVVEDPRGAVAPVHVYHVPARLSPEELNEIYSLGAIFAIKEPYIRESRDGFLIRIDSPPDLVRLYPSSPLLRSMTWPPNSAIPPSNRTAAQHKDEGNRLFALRRWRAALESYSLGLDFETEGGKLSTVLRSNRAATELKFGQPGAALRDCETALRDPYLDEPASSSLRQKVLFRAASAEYALQRFKAADARLCTLLDLQPDDVDALDLYRRTQTRLAESTRGDYDWPGLYDTSRTALSLDVADYTGSMIASAEIAGRGRGLVATRDIEAGELLLVARPFAMGRGDPARKSFVVGANLFTETLDPYAHFDLVSLLIEKLVDDPTVRGRLFDLHAGDGFLPLSTEDADSTSIDTSRLEAIATYNAFHTESLSQKATPLSPAEEAANNIHAPSSLYYMPSFLNHACIGNVTYSFLADVIFFRARRPVKAGEELLDSYVDSLEGIKRRTDKLDKHRFVCTCDLCEWDRRDGEAKCDERERLAEALEALTDRIHGDKDDAAPHLDAMRAFVDKIQATYDAARPRLRPALYPALRLLAQTYSAIGRAAEAVELEVRALEALGAVFVADGRGVEWSQCREVPRVGDVNAVLSSLFIAKQLQVLGKTDASCHWISVARRIEAGQAGAALFATRYRDWAAKHGLDLSVGSIEVNTAGGVLS